MHKLKKIIKALKIKSLLWSVVRAVIVIGICFVILYPLIVKLSTSFMQEADLYDVTVNYIPKHFTFDNYVTVWNIMDFPTAFTNTMIFSLVTSLMQLISCTLVGYGFARFNFPFKKLLFGLVLVTILIPPQVFMIPLFLHFKFFDIFGILSLFNGGKGVNLLDTFWPFILMSITGMGLKNGLYIYMMRQFFKGVSKELEEAAYVDGSGFLRTYASIMVPCAVPMMITIFLFSFVWQWNDNFYFSLFLQNTEVLPGMLSQAAKTLENHLAVNFGNYILNPARVSQINGTGTILTIIPLAVIYLFLQRYFIESIERSGIVG